MSVRYRFNALRAGAFKLDAGCMMGLIPRVVWSRSVPTDDRNRVTLCHNCLLLERLGTGPGPRLVVIEAGTGDKLDEASRKLFDLDGRWIQTALDEVGVAGERIDAVVISHLHFDHAGGLTRKVRAGEEPEWVGPAGAFTGKEGAITHGVRRTFPNARVHVQRREWEDALAGRGMMTRTYFSDHILPLRDHIELADTPSPFTLPDAGPAPGDPTRPERPDAELETMIMPGIWVMRVPGHTWGQQAVRFEDEMGRMIVFTPDVMPTAWHAGRAYSLAYDVEPYTSMRSRGWLLRRACENGWLLYLDHEPGEPLRRVVSDGHGWWLLAPV